MLAIFYFTTPNHNIWVFMEFAWELWTPEFKVSTSPMKAQLYGHGQTGGIFQKSCDKEARQYHKHTLQIGVGGFKVKDYQNFN